MKVQAGKVGHGACVAPCKWLKAKEGVQSALWTVMHLALPRVFRRTHTHLSQSADKRIHV